MSDEPQDNPGVPSTDDAYKSPVIETEDGYAIDVPGEGRKEVSAIVVVREAMSVQARDGVVKALLGL